MPRSGYFVAHRLRSLATATPLPKVTAVWRAIIASRRARRATDRGAVSTSARLRSGMPGEWIPRRLRDAQTPHRRGGHRRDVQAQPGRCRDGARVQRHGLRPLSVSAAVRLPTDDPGINYGGHPHCPLGHAVREVRPRRATSSGHAAGRRSRTGGAADAKPPPPRGVVAELEGQALASLGRVRLLQAGHHADCLSGRASRTGDRGGRAPLLPGSPAPAGFSASQGRPPRAAGCQLGTKFEAKRTGQRPDWGLAARAATRGWGNADRRQANRPAADPFHPFGRMRAA